MLSAVFNPSGKSFIVSGRGTFAEKRFHSGSEAALYAAKKSMLGHSLVFLDVVEAPHGSFAGSVWKTLKHGEHHTLQSVRIFVDHRPGQDLLSFHKSVDSTVVGYRVSSGKPGSAHETMIKDLGRAFKEAIWSSLQSHRSVVVRVIRRNGDNRSLYNVTAEEVR